MIRLRNASFQPVCLTPLETPRARLPLPRRLGVLLGACALAAALFAAGSALAARSAGPGGAFPATLSQAAATAHLDARATQPAPEWMGQALSDGPLSGLLSLAVNLGIVLALLYGTLWLLRRFGPAGLARHGRSIRVIESASLGQGRSLVVVEAGERRLLLGVTTQQISLVSELPAEAPAQRDSQR